jgi:MATE family multidrug resistance protein
LDRSRLAAILDLALPIIGGMASQNLFNLVDTAMVGRLGPVALAAVGVASFTTFMCMAVVMGLSAGVQAMASRRKGEGRLAETAVPLNGGIVIALCVSIPLSAALIWAAPALFPILNADADVVSEGVPYLQARLVGMAALGVNMAFRGFWNGVGLSGVYLRTLVVMHASNIALNYVLIFGALGAPALGTLGAGIGSAAATYIGAATYMWLAWRRARPNGFLAGLPRRATIATMLRVSVPSSVQQLFFAGGFTALFWIVGRVGTAEVAAANVLINVMLIAVLPGLGFGLAAASLVGQALGAGDAADARRWGWDVVKVAAAVMAVLGLPMLAVPEAILSVFLHEPETLALARAPLRLVGATIAIEGVGMVLVNALAGAGATRQVMAATITLQWLAFLPLAYLVGPGLGLGLIGIWACQVAYRAVQALVMTGLWRRGRWAEIEV